MPDWFYRTIARGCLDRLPDRAARALALGTIGALGRVAPGRALIDLLGHMRPSGSLAGEKAGVHFASRVGLGPWLDPEGRATRALARFGCGFIEAGPVSIDAIPGGSTRRTRTGLAVPDAAGRAAASLDTWRRRLARQGAVGIPVWVRIAPRPGARDAEARADIEALAAAFAPVAAAFVVERAPAGSRLDLPRPWLRAGEPGEAAADDGSSGVVLDPPASAAPGERVARVRAARRHCGPAAVIVAAGEGDPSDLRALLEAGADLVEADGALVGTGPGVIKRTNELLAGPDGRHGSVDAPEAPRCAWFWGAVLGAALAAGGFLTLVLALGRVLLPYDEHHLGLDAASLERLLPRVHAFMAHDRATLAGTMLGLGAFYWILAREGLRRGWHWAQVAIVASALAGFLSFFSFLGFGYFDPLHAFVSAVLLQFALGTWMSARSGPRLAEDVAPDAHSDRAWRMCQWGQLLLVVHAAGLLIAGVVISAIGMTQVFVRTDLDFLCATAAELSAFNDRLIAVVAHDRASLGGMLLASGVAQLLATLWGFRRGRRWLWHGLLALGAPAYAAAIGIHFSVGYTSPWHLAPALAGLALGTAGLALTAPWLQARV